MLQNLLRTERRDYGVGGNDKGHAALTKRPNKGNEDRGRGESRTELDDRAAHDLERRESTLQQVRPTSSERLASVTSEERAARLLQMSTHLRERLPKRGRPGCNR